VTGTTDEVLAQFQRLHQRDPKALEAVLRVRVTELSRYNAHLLPIAREVIEKLFVLNMAMFVESDSHDGYAVLGALAMTLDNPRFTHTLRERVAEVRATAAAEDVRQRAAYPFGIERTEAELPATGQA
jgi:hypothetical protein